MYDIPNDVAPEDGENDVALTKDEKVFEELGVATHSLIFGWELIKVVLIAVAIIVPVRYFIVQPFFVSGASMEDTFNDADYILIDEISYRFKDPTRGDIIVFKFPNDERQFFIKRVIGMPGETVKISKSQVIILNDRNPQGLVLKEGYLMDGIRTEGSVTTRLGEKEYFVLGDNREHSSDSRFWGAVKRSEITGRVFARAWPFREAEFFDHPNYNE